MRHNILVNQLDSDNHNPQYPPDKLQKVKLTLLTLAQFNASELSGGPSSVSLSNDRS